jgi:allantoicase
MKSQLQKLNEQLNRVERELDKCRGTVMEDGWQTSRYAKKMRKWDFYANQKRQIQNKINDYENDN